MNTTTQQALEAARIKLDQVSAELRALEARAAEEARSPWEPKGGRFYLFTPCEEGPQVGDGTSDDAARLHGREYPTREAAESAFPYVSFFARLCCLAAELNPSGKVGGCYRLFYYLSDGWQKSVELSASDRDPWDLFETEDAALKACEIMNRDKWVTPSL